MVKLTLNGFLIKDADFHVLGNGNKIANLAVSCKSENPDDRKQKPPVRQIWNVSIYLTEKNSLGDYLKKSTNVLMTGKQWKERYTDKQGVEKESIKISVNSNDVELLQSGERKPTADGVATSENHEEPQDDWGKDPK